MMCKRKFIADEILEIVPLKFCMINVKDSSWLVVSLGRWPPKM